MKKCMKMLLLGACCVLPMMAANAGMITVHGVPGDKKAISVWPQLEVQLKGSSCPYAQQGANCAQLGIKSHKLARDNIAAVRSDKMKTAEVLRTTSSVSMYSGRSAGIDSIVSVMNAGPVFAVANSATLAIGNTAPITCHPVTFEKEMYKHKYKQARLDYTVKGNTCTLHVSTY